MRNSLLSFLTGGLLGAAFAVVCDAERVDLGVKIEGDGLDFRMYQYARNPDLERRLIEIERKFWHEHVLAQVPPEPINAEDLEKLWPGSAEKQVIADTETTTKVYELSYVRKKIKELQNLKSSLENEIKLKMKDADTLVDANLNGLATWKSQTRSDLNRGKLKEQEPEIYTGYLEESSIRVFRLNNKLEV